MNPAVSKVLRGLLRGRAVGALATLHEGEPFVSMVPFALAGDGRALVVHVSHLAAHTQNMLRHPRVSLLVVAAESPDVMPQALPRVTIQGVARPLADSDSSHADAHSAYHEKFPDAEGLFAFPDFKLFRIDITGARLVSGFAQATNVSTESLAAAVLDEESA